MPQATIISDDRLSPGVTAFDAAAVQSGAVLHRSLYHAGGVRVLPMGRPLPAKALSLLAKLEVGSLFEVQAAALPRFAFHCRHARVHPEKLELGRALPQAIVNRRGQALLEVGVQLDPRLRNQLLGLGPDHLFVARQDFQALRLAGLALQRRLRELLTVAPIPEPFRPVVAPPLRPSHTGAGDRAGHSAEPVGGWGLGSLSVDKRKLFQEVRGKLGAVLRRLERRQEVPYGVLNGMADQIHEQFAGAPDFICELKYFPLEDDYLVHHSLNMAIYTALIARRLTMRPTSLQELLVAAPSG